MAPRTGIEDVDRHVAAQMRALRIAAGITQPRMADLLGISYQALHKREKGANRVTAGQLALTAKVLGVPITALLPGGPAAEVADDQHFIVLEHMRRFQALPREQQEAINVLVRAMLPTGDAPVTARRAEGEIA